MAVNPVISTGEQHWSPNNKQFTTIQTCWDKSKIGALKIFSFPPEEGPQFSRRRRRIGRFRSPCSRHRTPARARLVTLTGPSRRQVPELRVTGGAEACQALLFPSRPRKRNQDGEFPSDADTMLFDDTASATLGGSDRHRPVPSPAPESVRGRLAAAASALPAARADASRRCVRAALFLEPASSRTVRPRRRVRVSESPVRWVGRRQALLRNIGSPRLRRPG